MNRNIYHNQGKKKKIQGFHKPGSKNTMVSRGLPVPHFFSESDRVPRNWCQYLSWAPVKKSLEEVIKTGKCHSPYLTGVLLDQLCSAKSPKAGGHRVRCSAAVGPVFLGGSGSGVSKKTLWCCRAHLPPHAKGSGRNAPCL